MYNKSIVRQRERPRNGEIMKLETLMIKAIRELKKVSAKAEIRSIYVAEGSGSHKNWKDAAFCIEYVEEDGGEYKSTYINIVE